MCSPASFAMFSSCAYCCAGPPYIPPPPPNSPAPPIARRRASSSVLRASHAAFRSSNEFCACRKRGLGVSLPRRRDDQAKRDASYLFPCVRVPHLELRLVGLHELARVLPLLGLACSRVLPARAQWCARLRALVLRIRVELGHILLLLRLLTWISLLVSLAVLRRCGVPRILRLLLLLWRSAVRAVHMPDELLAERARRLELARGHLRLRGRGRHHLAVRLLLLRLSEAGASLLAPSCGLWLRLVAPAVAGGRGRALGKVPRLICVYGGGLGSVEPGGVLA